VCKNFVSLGKLQSVQESLFTYTGEDDNFDTHNPSSVDEPPFLEDLVAAQHGSAQFNSRVESCSTNGTLSTTCLYDFLLTDNANIASSSMENEERSAEITSNIGKQKLQYPIIRLVVSLHNIYQFH